MQLPLVGGFNDGKHIEPKNRNQIRMAKPSSYSKSISHYEEIIGFEYEIYTLESISVGGKVLKFYIIEGMSLPEAIEKLIFGYKQFNKVKGLDLHKTV